MAMVLYGKNPKLLNLHYIQGVQYLSFVHELRSLCCPKCESKLPEANRCMLYASTQLMFYLNHTLCS